MVVAGIEWDSIHKAFRGVPVHSSHSTVVSY